MTIGSQDTATAALRMVRLLADQARKELGSNADRGTSARPTVKDLNNTLERLAGIVKLMDEVVLPVFDLPPIPHATDVERRIVGKLVRDLLAAGYCLTIWNGGDEAEIERSADEAKIFATLAASDQDEIAAYHPSSKHRAGWVRLVWGNDTAVISDYTTNFETLLAGAEALADKLDNAECPRCGLLNGHRYPCVKG